MAFIGKQKRKLSPGEQLSSSIVFPFNLADHVINDGRSSANFERLCFKGCPVLPVIGKRLQIPKNQPEVVDMNRRALVTDLYITISSLDKTTRSKINLFRELVSYFKFLDDKEIKKIFSFDSIKLYINHLTDQYQQGVKGATLSQIQSLLKTIIKEVDPILFIQCKPIFMDFPRDHNPIKPYTDEEIKALVQALYRIFKDYTRCIVEGCTPDNFPLYSGKQLEDKSNWFSNKNKNIKIGVHGNTNVDLWKSDLTQVAYFLTCFYTGVNSSSLLGIKHSDVLANPFKEVSRGIYKLRTIKGRQSGKVNYIDVGFGTKAKEFLKKWIVISKLLTDKHSEYLFPKVIRGDERQMNSSDVSQLNKKFLECGLPSLTSQRFRKTKASLIIRSTESIFMVAEGLNNTPDTVAKHYSDGDSFSTEFSLASVLDIRQRTVLGEPLKEAIVNSAYKFKDPIREKIFAKSGDKIPSNVSNGLRCLNPHGEKSELLKKVLQKEGIANKNDEVACYKFLECFSCQYHAVIAEKQDVWLLLSFNDVILEVIARPAINSAPSSTLKKVHSTLLLILEKIKKEHQTVYDSAYKLYLEKPHPLWSEAEDLELLLGVYS